MFRFSKYLTVVLIVASTSLASSIKVTAIHENSISMYNRIKTGSDLIDFVFFADKKYTTEDKKFIAELKKDLDGVALPKATLRGNTILLNNFKIEILSATSGEYLINGKSVKISPTKPIKVTFKEIENALNSKQSKFNFLFINRAEAAGPLIVAAATVYGLGAMVTGGGCAALAIGFGGTSKEVLSKAARVCAEIAIAWPYALWSLYDHIKNENEVIEGSCEKSGPENKFGNLVKLRVRDSDVKRYMEDSEKELELYKNEYYFKTDEKTGKARIFIKGYDPKNQTYDQVYEPERYILFYESKSGASAMFNYVKNLENVCANGGTVALDKLIKSDTKISQGLIEIGKLHSSKNSQPRPAQAAPTDLLPLTRARK